MLEEEEAVAVARDEQRRGPALFVTSRTLSIIGDMAAVTALSVYVYETFGSATLVSGIFVVRVLPRLLGPLAGALADRYDLRTLLVVCDVAACALFACVAVFLPSYWTLLALLLVAESVATVSLPAARTWLARRVDADRRGRINGVLTASVSIGFGVGAGIGGLSASALGPRLALLLNALTFAASAVLVWAAGSVPAPRSQGERPEPLLSSALAGTHLIVVDRRLAALALGLVGIGLASSIDRPAVVALTQQDLPGDGGAYGLLLALISVGVLVASLAIGRVPWLGPTWNVFVVSIALQMAAHFLLGLAPSLVIAATTALMMGVGNGLESVAATTLLQNTAPATQVGTVMAAVISATFVADAVGSLIGGFLVDTIGARPVFAVAAFIMACCGAFAWNVHRRSTRLVAAPGEELR
ncbi:MFS transporter [Micromonospora sp. NPDC051925]|uniref:MFS transporter n=1 Tax=Micromonospora sp. NPDC051925 TaxID=3364288 RepID=UPI0037C80F94